MQGGEAGAQAVVGVHGGAGVKIVAGGAGRGGMKKVHRSFMWVLKMSESIFHMHKSPVNILGLIVFWF